MEIYQFGSSYPSTTNTPNSPFYNKPIPTHCYQLTGAYAAYNGGAEIEPSRLADYVVSAPGAFAVSFTNSAKKTGSDLAGANGFHLQRL